MTARIVAILALVLAGCASGSRSLRASATPGEQEAFAACRTFLEARACPGGGDHMDASIRRDACIDDLARQLAALPAGPARRAYLVQAGCPEALVDAKLTEGRP